MAADRGSDPEVVEAIERAHHLAADGLAEARDAIAALRGEELPGPERLEQLADAYPGACRLTVEGTPHELRSEARVAVYRTAQEALTNVLRHSAADRVELVLGYEPDGTRLVVQDHGPGAPVTVGPGHAGRRLRTDRDARARRAPGRPAERRADRRRLPGGAVAAEVIRVLLADDQRVVREGLGTLLGLLDGIELVGTAADGEEVLALAARHDPDVVLMDLRMPRMDGIEAIRRLAERGERPRTIALDDLRRRRLGARRPTGGRARLSDQGRRRRADPRRGRGGRARRGGARPGRPAPRAGGAHGTCGGGAARRADATRGRGARADRRGPHQHRDRRAPRGQRRHRQDARQPHLRQGRACATARRPWSTPTRTGSPRASTGAWW